MHVDHQKASQLPQTEKIALVFASNLSKGGKDGEVPCPISVAAGMGSSCEAFKDAKERA
jgi:hypothetical protein